MPKFDIPVEENESNSSLSLSSNENGSMSNRSMASSISIGLNNPSPSLANERPRSNYNPISTNWQSVCQEPTLDAVLVKKNSIIWIFSMFCKELLRIKKTKIPEKIM